MMTIAYIVFIVLLFWLLLIRPQRKQKREREALMSSLSVGDEVYTVGGILGTITRVKEHTLWLRISDKCEIEVFKTSVGGKQNFGAAPEPKIEESEAKKEEK